MAWAVLHGGALCEDGRPSWGGQLSEHLFSFLNDCIVNKKLPLFHNKGSPSDEIKNRIT